MVSINSKNRVNAESVEQDKWCPICLQKFVEGKCPRHPILMAYLDHDPLAGAVVAAHCDHIGMVDLEVVR
jgi:hypothetical protein